MDCPLHKEPIRVEVNRHAPQGMPYMTGFCEKCLRHYPCCTSTLGTDHCDLVQGHPPPHLSSNRCTAWMDPAPVRKDGT